MNSASFGVVEQVRSTEIGELPESWEVIALGEALSRAQYGLSIRGQKSGLYPILRMNCQDGGRVVFRDLQFVDLDDQTFEAYRLNQGDLLFNRTNSYELVGRTAIVDSSRPAVFASYLLRLATDQTKLLPSFLNFYFASEPAQAALKSFATRGVSQSNISASKLKHLRVPRPPLTEQRAIASVLSEIQTTVELQDRIVARLKELKAATMAKLFREGLGGEPLKQTEIGEIPESWEIVKIADLGDIVTGTTPPTKSPENYGGEIPFISPADIGDLRCVRKSQKTLTEAGLRVSRPLPPRTVLVVCIGSTIGKVGMTTTSRSCTNQQINAVIPTKALVPEFVYYAMLRNADRVRRISTPSPVPILSKAVFSDLSVAIPREGEERKGIARILCHVDDLIEVASSKRRLLDLAFKFSLKELVTGTSRLPTADSHRA